MIMFKKYRLYRGYTQEQLAEMTNLGIRTIQRADSGDTSLTLESFAKLVLALQIPNREVMKYLKNIATYNYVDDEEKNKIAS